MTITLPVVLRDKTTKINELRIKGIVPAVVYGPKQEPINISLDAKVFEKVCKEAGESTVIELAGLVKPIEVLIKNVDFNPVKQQTLHVDFYAIEKGKEMTVCVPLEFINEAPVEKDKIGSVTKVLHEIEVTCVSSDLPSHIDVDLSTLVSVEDKIHIKDLKLAKGVTVHLPPEDIVVVVTETSPEEVSESEVEMNENAGVVSKK